MSVYRRTLINRACKERSLLARPCSRRHTFTCKTRRNVCIPVQRRSSYRLGPRRIYNFGLCWTLSSIAYFLSRCATHLRATFFRNAIKKVATQTRKREAASVFIFFFLRVSQALLRAKKKEAQQRQRLDNCFKKCF